MNDDPHAADLRVDVRFGRHQQRTLSEADEAVYPPVDREVFVAGDFAEDVKGGSDRRHELSGGEVGQQRVYRTSPRHGRINTVTALFRTLGAYRVTVIATPPRL